jgi:RNA polymerase sigma-70 factor, ECF subfamily
MSKHLRTSDDFADVAVPLLPSLYNFAFWLSRDATYAEDLVQETYAKALKAFPDFVPGTNFHAWIFRILRNTWLSSKAGLAVRMTIALDDDYPEPADEHTPESLLLDSMSRTMLERAIEALPVTQREVLLLCEFEEMSYCDVAQTLSVPIGTVMSRLSRARKAVRRALERESHAVQRSGR